MPTPTKPLQLLQGHLTKAEKEQRAKAEAELLTGSPLREWPETKSNPEAHKHFLRVSKLLGSIGKNDALYEPSINRYCALLAECAQIEKDKRLLSDAAQELAEDRGDMDLVTYLDRLRDINGQILAYDRSLQTKRKMLLDLEKENIMTIASALRSVPKKVEQKEQGGMARFMAQKRGGGVV